MRPPYNNKHSLISKLNDNDLQLILNKLTKNFGSWKKIGKFFSQQNNTTFRELKTCSEFYKFFNFGGLMAKNFKKLWSIVSPYLKKRNHKIKFLGKIHQHQRWDRGYVGSKTHRKMDKTCASVLQNGFSLLISATELFINEGKYIYTRQGIIETFIGEDFQVTQIPSKLDTLACRVLIVSLRSFPLLLSPPQFSGNAIWCLRKRKKSNG